MQLWWQSMGRNVLLALFSLTCVDGWVDWQSCGCCRPMLAEMREICGFSRRSRSLTDSCVLELASPLALRGGQSSEQAQNHEICEGQDRIPAQNSTEQGQMEREADPDYLFFQKLEACEDEELRAHILAALETLSDALRLFGPKRCIVSFNGGKDADVVLHLSRAALAKHNHDAQTEHKLQLAYFHDARDFDEISTHIRETTEKFGVELRSCGASFTKELGKMVEEQAPLLLAFVLGTRRGDPNAGKQESFAPSSAYLAPFMRVNPILGWSYGTVWRFLRAFELPYCALYDQGYSSLGHRDNTLPNPRLRTAAGSFAPAHTLADFSQERAGRELSPHHVPAHTHHVPDHLHGAGADQPTPAGI